ncbi:MAG: 4Fe-4S binding protein [Lentisphaerae bacterium]|nr:4Fe-4S binding protein [Lentisphaerota bacterium]
MRVLRRVIQIGVLLLIVLAARDSAFRRDRLRESRRLQDAFAPEAPPYERLLASHTGLDQALNGLRGNLWYARVGRVAVADTLAVVENLFASRTFTLSFAIAGTWLIMLSLGVGRVFCSYLCPAALLFEGGSWLRRGLLRLGCPLPTTTLPRFTKYLLLGVGLSIAAATGCYVLAWIYPPRILSLELDYYFFHHALRFGGLFLLGLLLVEVLALPRGWCTHLCPGGALYSLLGAGRLLRIRHHADRCTNCGACRPVCPYDLRPDRASPGMECDNCLRCIAACPEDALTFRRAQAAVKEGSS